MAPRALTDTLLTPAGPHALLILDLTPDRVTAPGSAPPPWGLPPVTATPPTGPATIDLASPLTEPPGWHLDLSAPRAARLTRDGALLWAGECAQAPPWLALITATARCALLVASLGLWAPRPTPAPMETMLNHPGDLVGALIPATAR
jgi:hypothetical protein